MTVGSDNPFPSVLFAEHVDPSNPGAGTQRLFVDTDHILKLIDSSGTVTTYTGATGAVATDAIWDAKGDLAGGTGANTAAKLTVGSNDTVLMADSGQTTGLKWVASQTPSTQAFSDSATEGTADTYARGDHKHGMPASSGGVTFSTLGTTSAGASFATTRGLYVKKVTVASTGLLASIGVFVKGNGSDYVSLNPVVISDTAAAPINLLGPTPETLAVGVAGVVGVILNTTVRAFEMPVGRVVTAADYWIGVSLQGVVAAPASLAYNSGSGGDYTQATAGDSAKDSSVAAFSSTSNDYCIYANIIR